MSGSLRRTRVPPTPGSGPWSLVFRLLPPSPPILLVSSSPTGLSQFFTLTARSPAPLPLGLLVPLPGPSNLFAVCGHEVEAAGGNGQSDRHSGEFQVTPPQNGAERAATGLRKGPRGSETGDSQPPKPPCSCLLAVSPHPNLAFACPSTGPSSTPSPTDPRYLSPSCCSLSTWHSLAHQTDGLPGQRGVLRPRARLPLGWGCHRAGGGEG